MNTMQSRMLIEMVARMTAEERQSFIEEMDKRFPNLVDDLGSYISKHPEMSRLGHEIMDVLQADAGRTVSEAERKYFSDYTAKLDKVRKTNLVDLDPRFKKYLI